MKEVKTSSKKKKSKKVRKIINLISKTIFGFSFLFLFILGYFIYSANILPVKYFIIILVILVVFLAIQGFFVLKKNTKNWVIIFIDLIAFLFLSVEIYGVFLLNDTMDFLRNTLGAKFETNVYHIIVNKDSSYQNLEDIKDKTLKTVKDLEDVTELEKNVMKKVEVTIEYEENIVELLTQITEDKELILLVNSGNYDAMINADENFEEKVRIIDTINIVVEIENNNSSSVDVTKTPFVVYLSGIDTRSGYLPSRSLSDVNIILAINPNTRRILMVHIPRDYYVPLHGKNGLKDKLTHAGTIGGIELSMATIGDLLEIELPYYVRVNFNAVVNLVDAIGGINLNSDVNYSFTCHTDKSCSFHPGLNSVGGKCALAFARERMAYSTGDRHRGENQEQVLEKVIQKVTSSSTLISNYSSILSALDGTFQTNISTEDITSLVKMQIDDMAPWKMESLNVDGVGGMKPTYSYPNQKLYVMEPKMETVEKAVARLNEVLDTKE